MPAPRNPNTAAATAAVVHKALERKAAELRAVGRDGVLPPTPTQHLHPATLRCWTPTLCAGHEAYAKLRAFAVDQGDAELLNLVDQVAEYLPVPGEWTPSGSAK